MSVGLILFGAVPNNAPLKRAKKDLGGNGNVFTETRPILEAFIDGRLEMIFEPVAARNQFAEGRPLVFRRRAETMNLNALRYDTLIGVVLQHRDRMGQQHGFQNSDTVPLNGHRRF